MARFLGPDVLWDVIRRQARRSNRITVAVGYLGRNPAKVLRRWPRGSVVIADLSDEAVRGGESSARGALTLLREHGVAIRSLAGLHAKIYLFDKTAVVSSANLSEHSESLDEAGVLLTYAPEVQAVETQVRRFRTEAEPLDATLLRERAKLEPRRRRPPPSRYAKGQRALLIPGDRVWVVPVVHDPLRPRAEEQAAREWVKSEALGPDGLQWLYACPSGVRRRLKHGDKVVIWWEAEGRNREKLDGPYDVVGPADLGRRFGERRYRVALYRRRTRQRGLDQRNHRKLLRLLGVRKPRQVSRLPKQSLRAVTQLLSSKDHP